jgi:exonuclease VII small subunit
MKKSPRLQSIEKELERAEAEYATAKEVYADARVRLEAAIEGLAGARRIAVGGMHPFDLLTRGLIKPDFRFVGMNLKDAIVNVLQKKAWIAATEALKSNIEFDPCMDVYEMGDELEEGGFDFRTSSPSREINAALMQLKGITKLEDGSYHIENAQDVLQQAATAIQQVPSADALATKFGEKAQVKVTGLIEAATREATSRKRKGG